MKKATFFACACALLMGAQSLLAQGTAQEVTYTEDASQGLLLNKFNSNWFITVDGGAGVYFSRFDKTRKFTDRIAPAADIYVGKWFSPIIGARIGASWLQSKGLANFPTAVGALPNEYRPDGFYKTKYNQLGPAADVMLNLTNWWCSYKADRVYNAIVYAGGGAYFTLDDDWHNAHDTNFFGRVGFINSFNLSKRVALSLDLRATFSDGHIDDKKGVDKIYANLNAFLGLTFNLGKTNWAAPVVPVCPPAENCDALRARLSAAEARVADLERQLQDCLNRKPEVIEAEPEALATIYFPIGVSRLTREDKNIVNAVADVLKADTSKKYDVKGYADTYTGTDAINNRLRKQRSENVVKQLVSRGVSADQVNAVPVQGNLHGDNEALVSLDRCAVIVER